MSRTWQPPPAPLCTYFNHNCVRFHSPATLSHHSSRLPIRTCVQKMAATASTTLHLFQPHLCALPFPCNPLPSFIMSSIPTTFVSRTWQPPPAPLCSYFSHTCVRFHSPATLSHDSSCLPFQPRLCPEHGSHPQHHFAPISTTPVCASIPLQPSPIIHHVFHSNHTCVQKMAVTTSTTLHLFQPYLYALSSPCNPLPSFITSPNPHLRPKDGRHHQHHLTRPLQHPIVALRLGVRFHSLATNLAHRLHHA